MDLMYAVIEAVFISFFMGAIIGGIVATHLSNKRHAAHQETPEVSSDMQPIKIKVKR